MPEELWRKVCNTEQEAVIKTIPKKKKYKKTTWWSEEVLQVAESGENYNLKRYTYPNVHSSSIYNSQDIKATLNGY